MKLTDIIKNTNPEMIAPTFITRMPDGKVLDVTNADLPDDTVITIIFPYLEVVFGRSLPDDQ